MKQGKDKYKKIAKNFQLDDDLFNFLDGISKKVQGRPEEYEQDEQMEL